MPEQNPIIRPNKRATAPKKEDEQEEYKPKLSMWEIVIITPFYLISDTLELFLFLFGLSDFGIISMIRTSISEFYFIVIKKMGKEIWLTSLVVGVITAMPYIGALIPSTIGWGIVVYIDWFGMKKAESILKKTGAVGKVINKAADKASAVTGKV
ncbi:MAG: hypothetical protein M1155_00235 [Patescibacteria group bacterium]|nr:hypothetical protein [Patescibacteria group bacterium]